MALPELITDPAIIAGYLSDASNTHGSADALLRPTSTLEVAAIIRHCQANVIPLTVTARRTSTTGAPVPEGGWLLSTEKLATLHAPDDVDAGMLLGEYQAAIEAQGLFFPPDPTSRHECSVGGAVACNASGARTYAYGPTRPWIRKVEAVLADGTVVQADRETPCPWPVPAWSEPHVKTAAGYFPATNLLDALIGAEGTLGVVTRVWTRLIPLPRHVLAIFAFFPSRASLLDFLTEARATRTRITPGGAREDGGAGLRPRCIEYFDRRSLDLIRSRVPVSEADSAVLFEIEHDGEPPLEAWIDALQRHGALVDDTIVAEDEAGLARLHAIRHALPAEVNEIIARNGVRKVGTDFAVPDSALPEMLALYDDTGGMPAVCFGHLGDNHLHLNFLPRTQEEWAQAKDRYMTLARRAVALGGTVSAEHGIGRLKRAHLAMMVGDEQIAAWRALRKLADPSGILGRGVMV